MARYTGPVCKQCRREGQKLFLKGERCLTDKCGVERRSYPPGEHGRGRQKQSEYRVQLREKQKAKRYYGVQEKQFAGYYDRASSQPGITGENLLRMLELRLGVCIKTSQCDSLHRRVVITFAAVDSRRHGEIVRLRRFVARLHANDLLRGASR